VNQKDVNGFAAVGMATCFMGCVGGWRMVYDSVPEHMGWLRALYVIVTFLALCMIASYFLPKVADEDPDDKALNNLPTIDKDILLDALQGQQVHRGVRK